MARQLDADLAACLPALVAASDGIRVGQLAEVIADSVAARSVEQRHRTRASKVAQRFVARGLASRDTTGPNGRYAPLYPTEAASDPDALARCTPSARDLIPHAPADVEPPPPKGPSAEAKRERLEGLWRRYLAAGPSTDPEVRQQLRGYLCTHGLDQWRYWLPEMFPSRFSVPFAPFHAELWEWVLALERDRPADPFVAAWARGAAKSANAEAVPIVLGARGVSRYCLYVSGTQLLADSHVESLGSLLESPAIAEFYPALGNRAVNKFGQTRGWRRNRLVTEHGLVVDALGLEGSLRGLRFEDQRPDLIILDDIDDDGDGPGEVAKKIRLITRKLLPAGDNVSAGGTKVLAVQNLIHPESVFSRLVSEGRPGEVEPAEFLRPRHVSGPYPALRNMRVTDTDSGYRVDGDPTWPEGQGVEECNRFIRVWGFPSFMSEAQHEEPDLAGGMFSHIDFDAIEVEPEELPEFRHAIVVVDPAVSKSDTSDACGVQVDARGTDDLIYRLFSWEQRATPLEALTLAIRWGVHWDCDEIVIETDQGGDTWESVYREAVEVCRKEGVFGDETPTPTRKRPGPAPGSPGRRAAVPKVPEFHSEKAGSTQASKAERAQRMLVDYDTRQLRHLAGQTRPLRRALRRFPLFKPYDLVDASYWGWHRLEDRAKRPVNQRFAARRPRRRAARSRPQAAGMLN